MTATQLHEYLQQPGNAPLLLDVREPWEYETCQLQGSRLVPMGQIQAVYDEFDPAQEIVVICHHGIRSRVIAGFLERHGFTNVINLTGGIDAWAREIDRDMQVY
jgi:rhodanese-related sulfurtransferase